MKTISISVVIVMLMCAAAAIGGVLVGLTVNEKEVKDLIWLLYNK